MATNRSSAFAAVKPLSRRAMLLGLAMLAAPACDVTGLARGATVERQPTDFFLFFDRSISIGDKSNQRWIEQDVPALLAELAPGDWMAGYGVHGETATAEPFMKVDLGAPTASSMTEQLRSQAQKRQAISDAVAKLKSFLSGPKAKQTDLYGAFTRVGGPRTGRRKVIVFFSDMLESVPGEVDFEKVPLTPERNRILVTELLRRHGWTKEMFSGVEFRCYLESAEDAERGPGKTASRNTARPNGHEALHAFWRLLIEGSLGGHLNHFENAPYRKPEAPAGAGKSS